MKIQSIMMMLLLVAGAFAAEELPLSTDQHSIDDIYTVVVVMQEDVDSQLTTLRYEQTTQLNITATAIREEIAEFKEQTAVIENQEKAYIEERTNPLRIGLLPIAFFCLVMLFIGKGIAEQQWVYLRHGIKPCPVCNFDSAQYKLDQKRKKEADDKLKKEVAKNAKKGFFLWRWLKGGKKIEDVKPPQTPQDRAARRRL